MIFSGYLGYIESLHVLYFETYQLKSFLYTGSSKRRDLQNMILYNSKSIIARDLRIGVCTEVTLYLVYSKFDDYSFESFIYTGISNDIVIKRILSFPLYFRRQFENRINDTA